MFEKLFDKLFRKRKTVGLLRPGESMRVNSPIPMDAKGAIIVINYGDEFGNEYETRCTLDFKEKKVIKQEFIVTKKVKEIGDVPKLELNENNINWPDLS